MDFLEILELCQTNLVMTDSINHKKWQFLSGADVSRQECEPWHRGSLTTGAQTGERFSG